MNFKSALKPIQYLDEQVLRHYTKLGKRVDINHGKRKYLVGFILNDTHSRLTTAINYHIGGPALGMALWGLQSGNDCIYNFYGIFNDIKEDEATSETVAKDYSAESFRNYNAKARLPVFLSGIALIGIYAVNAVNCATSQTQMDLGSTLCLPYGLGQLSLASSMYLKDINPKLLDKVPYWRKAYEWLKEKARELAPSPIPSPVPGYARTIEDLV